MHANGGHGWRRPGLIVRALVSALRQDRVGDLAAMMTYYAIFALFPMGIFVITIGLLVIPPDTIMAAATMATRTMPDVVAAMAVEQVARMQGAARGDIALGSALIALWGASRGSLALGRALNEVHGVRDHRPWWKVQLIGIAVTLAVAVLLILAMGLLVIGPMLGTWMGDGVAFETGWTASRWLGAALLVLVIWALLYRFLPDTRAPLRLLTPGAVVAVLLWIGISLLFAIYVRNFDSYERTYGVLGAVLVFLAWLWLSNMAMLIGAEINDVLERKEAVHGDRAAELRDGGGRLGQRPSPG